MRTTENNDLIEILYRIFFNLKLLYMPTLYVLFGLIFFFIITKRLGWIVPSLGFLRFLKTMRYSLIALGCLYFLSVISMFVFSPEEKFILNYAIIIFTLLLVIVPKSWML